MIKIYGYQLSQATMRVRIALNFKKVAYAEQFLDLLQGDQFAASYKAVNPQQVVPAVVIDGKDFALFQSMAVLEYIEEVYQDPALLPADPFERARVRGLAQIVVSDTHRPAVPSTRAYIKDTLGHSDVELKTWIHHWVGIGLEAFETRLATDGRAGLFCHGDTPTFADLCLFPQIVSAKRLALPLEPYPNIMAIFDRCTGLEEFRNGIPA
jgi:maleylacetoacetate isomerase